MYVGRFSLVTQLVTRGGHVSHLLAYSVRDRLDYRPRHLLMSVAIFLRLPSVTMPTYYFKLGYEAVTSNCFSFIGTRGSVVVKVVCYKLEGRGFETR
jgi:hypothetical protein